MGVSLNGRPFLGELAPGLYAVAGYNGAGIAMGTALGMTVAELASGADNEALADALALTAPALFPPLAAQRTTESRRVAALNERAGAYL